MTVKKTSLKLFIASSFEVEAERDKIILILFLLNKAFPHLHLEPVMWEYDLPKSSHPGFNRLQDAINSKLDECQLAVFIFFTKLGKYTKEEFEYANQKKLPSF